jgi:hypothetical protein
MNPKLSERFQQLALEDRKQLNSLKLITETVSSNNSPGQVLTDGLSIGECLDDSLEMAMMEHTIPENQRANFEMEKLIT